MTRTRGSNWRVSLCVESGPQGEFEVRKRDTRTTVLLLVVHEAVGSEAGGRQGQSWSLAEFDFYELREAEFGFGGRYGYVE